MRRNIEIKARIETVETMTARVAAIADHGPIELLQDDVFFTCACGRLKLRTLSASEGELIFYQRTDEAGPKESSFVIAATSAPAALREALARAYGCIGRVRKRRTLYLVGRTRVHLDRVDQLGDFVELEVVLSEGETSQAGMAEALHLMATLGIAPSQLVEGAYVDLLADRRKGGYVHGHDGRTA